MIGDSVVEFLKSIPSVESRKNSIFFKSMVRVLAMNAENEFHWIIYATYRNLLFIAVISFGLLVIGLNANAPLSEDIVKSHLRFFTVGMSFPALLILSFSTIKARTVVGFMSIDYVDTFPRKGVRPESTKDRSSVLKTTAWLLFVIGASYVFGYFSIITVLKFFNMLLSIKAIAAGAALYAILANFVAALSLVFIMVHTQYKNYFDQIPK